MWVSGKVQIFFFFTTNSFELKDLVNPKHRQDRKRFKCNGGQQLEIQPSI